MDELVFCHKCESLHAILNFSTKEKENLSICIRCYKQEVKKGKLPTLDELGVNFIKQVINSLPPEEQNEANKKQDEGSSYPVATAQNPNATPILNSLGKNLTLEASKGHLDPVIGRHKEIEKTVRVLSRRGKNNPVLVGEPGVGKTAVVEGLAQRIVNGQVPDALKSKQVFSVNIGNLVAGTKYRGEFEERMKNLVEEIKSAKHVIIFFDEIHTIIGAGGAEGAVDASNILKPALSRGEIQVLGATTIDEYRRHIEKDAALERRFQRVLIDEPSKEETIQILHGLKTNYEKHHGVTISDEAIIGAVEFSTKYVADRFLPDKAIDLIDEACAEKRLQYTKKSEELMRIEAELKQLAATKKDVYAKEDFKASEALMKKEEELLIAHDVERSKESDEKIDLSIAREDVAYIVGEWTGIPVQRLKKEEKDKVKLLEEELTKHVKGQGEAIHVISKAVRRNKMGLKHPNRPVGVFLLLGPTGVGKTELAKSVAQVMYGSEERMIRVNMNEYMEKHTVSKLIGSPPGYAGYEDEGSFTKALRQKPYSLILLDEIEKAHPDVFNLLLQLMDEGQITDSKGRVINARNTIILMTSNVGSDLYSKQKGALGFGNEKDDQASFKEQIEKRVKEVFKPEFINRLDGKVMFNRLSRSVMLEIAQKFLEEFRLLASENDIELKYSQKFIEHMAEIGYNPTYGARTLRREIEKVMDMLADKIADSEGTTHAFQIGFRNNAVYIQ